MNIQKYQWSMGNGQCPACYGRAPSRGWWTEYVGHEHGCPIADTMEKAGMKPIYKHLNPERTVGRDFWAEDEKNGGNGMVCFITYGDPLREEKLKRNEPYYEKYRQSKEYQDAIRPLAAMAKAVFGSLDKPRAKTEKVKE